MQLRGNSGPRRQDITGYELADGGERWRGCTITRADGRLELFDGDGGSMGERLVAWATEP